VGENRLRDSKALLLATMFALWQAMSDRGWTEGGWAHVDSSTSDRPDRLNFPFYPLRSRVSSTHDATRADRSEETPKEAEGPRNPPTRSPRPGHRAREGINGVPSATPPCCLGLVAALRGSGEPAQGRGSPPNPTTVGLCPSSALESVDREQVGTEALNRPASWVGCYLHPPEQRAVCGEEASATLVWDADARPCRPGHAWRTYMPARPLSAGRPSLRLRAAAPKPLAPADPVL